MPGNFACFSCDENFRRKHLWLCEEKHVIVFSFNMKFKSISDKPLINLVYFRMNCIELGGKVLLTNKNSRIISKDPWEIQDAMSWKT